MSALEYAVVTVHIVGNPEAGYDHVYATDAVRHRSRAAAIRHGVRVHDHDDFLLAHLRGNEMVGLSWQYEDRDDRDDLDEMDHVAQQIGWDRP